MYRFISTCLNEKPFPRENKKCVFSIHVVAKAGLTVYNFIHVYDPANSEFH